MRKIALFLGALLLLPGTAFAQAIQQNGPVTAGHALAVISNGNVADGGPANNGLFNAIGITQTGVPFCINDGPISSGGVALAYHELCLGANSLGGGLISYNALNGASQLPLQVNVNGSTVAFGGGTVNAGTANQLAYYATTGNALSGLTGGNSGVLVTSSMGVPSISTTLPSGLTIPGYLSAASPTFTGTVTFPDSTTWTSSTITPNTALNALFASPPAIGGTSAAAAHFTTLNASGTVTFSSALTFGNGGTGQSSYTDGQLLIGNTSTGGLSKGTITQGTGITVTNGNGSITIAATGGGGGCSTSGSAGQVLTDNGSGGCTSNAGATYASGTLTLGVNTSTAGIVKLFGSSTGNLSIKAAAAAGSSTVLTLPGGTTDFSATGGTSQVVKQTSSGAAFTVAQLACSDLSNGATGCSTATGTSGGTIPLLNAANTWSATQTFNGAAATLAMSVLNAGEPITVSATAATSTINFDFATQSNIYYTTNASGNWTLNFRYSSGTSLASAMSVGQVVTGMFAVTQGASPFYNNVVQVDGTTSGVTTICQGGCPSGGNASGVDVYTYAIVKTAGTPTYSVFETQVQFK